MAAALRLQVPFIAGAGGVIHRCRATSALGRLSSRLWAGLLDHEQDGAGHLGRAASLPGAGSSPRWATAGCHVLRMSASGASRAQQIPSGFTACGDWPAGVHSHSPPPPNTSLQNLRGSTHPRSSGKKSSVPQLRRLTGGPACRSRWTVELRRESWDTPVPEKRSPG